MLLCTVLPDTWGPVPRTKVYFFPVSKLKSYVHKLFHFINIYAPLFYICALG